MMQKNGVYWRLYAVRIEPILPREVTGDGGIDELTKYQVERRY